MNRVNKVLNKNHAIFVVFLLSCIFNSAYSANLPRGCERTGYEFDDPFVILNQAGDQTFYLIENITDSKVELQKHETEDVFMSPPLIAIMEKGRWAAFASDVRNIHFQCFTHDKFDIIRVNCRDAIQLCQYPRVKFALSNMGNYWVSVNKRQKNVIREAISKGILLRW